MWYLFYVHVCYFIEWYGIPCVMCNVYCAHCVRALPVYARKTVPQPSYQSNRKWKPCYSNICCSIQSILYNIPNIRAGLGASWCLSRCISDASACGYPDFVNLLHIDVHRDYYMEGVLWIKDFQHWLGANQIPNGQNDLYFRVRCLVATELSTARYSYSISRWYFPRGTQHFFLLLPAYLLADTVLTTIPLPQSVTCFGFAIRISFNIDFATALVRF